MPQYRRAFRPGGSFFLTMVTERRAPLFKDESARTLLRQAIDQCRVSRPFEIDAIVLLPDHWHLLLTLPTGDADYPTRIAAIKAKFSHEFLAGGGVEQDRSASRIRHRRRGVWQRHFWEHEIRNDCDLQAHVDYIHYNPVKHGLANCPHGWGFSSFSRAVSRRWYDADWQCRCAGRKPIVPDFDELPIEHME